MKNFFFNGSTHSKLDEKNRFVLPQQMRYGLVENGELEFTIALGLGGALAIYRRSDIEKIVKKFQAKQHVAKYQKFFTLFFSTLHHATCDKLGRVVLPPVLKKAAGIKSEIVIAGVLNKIEIWPKEKYTYDLESFLGGEDNSLAQMTEEAFALLEDQESDTLQEEFEQIVT
ncbi:MAG: division/cell wall cluster transcriptional repressor MraZ [Chlamydiia bacterium]|nr:division/cell wall cluster transcriptional repressor MraZ [Chlamydiia bacterium]